MRYTGQLNCVQSVQIGDRFGFQNGLFAKRSSTPHRTAAQQALPRPLRARRYVITLHTAAHRERIGSASPAQRSRSVFYTKLVAERGQGGSRYASATPATR